MTLLADPSQTATGATQPHRAALQSAMWGAVGAASSLVLVLAVVVLIWQADTKSPGALSQALAAGSGIWLVMGGARVSVEGTSLGFLPLLAFLVPLAGAALSAGHVLKGREADDEGWVADLLPRSALSLLAAWCAGYAAIAAAAAGWAATSLLSPVGVTVAGPMLLVPLLGSALAVGRAAREDEWLLGPRLDGSVLPIWLRRSAAPALKGLVLLLGVGSAVVVGAVVLSWDRVAEVDRAVGVAGLGSVVFWAVQAASLPNVALWALSFLAGPGFSVVDGAHTTWSGASSGLLPLVPLLAALPQPQAFPWFVSLLVAIPVACGGVIGRWALRTVARLSPLRTKAAVAASAAVSSAVGVGALDAFGGASLGSYRLADVGAPALLLTGALAIELLVGALVVALWDSWQLRR